MVISEYKIYYADGTVYTSADGEWEAFPDSGVVALVLFYDTQDHTGNPRRQVISNERDYQLEGHAAPKYGATQGAPARILRLAEADVQRPFKSPTNTISTRTGRI